MALPRSRTRQGQDGLDAILADPRGALIASDFDGTLSPIVPDPDAAYAHPGAAQALSRLAAVAGTVAIITGRPAADAVRLGGFAGIPGLFVLGHYGAERWHGGELTAAPPPDGVGEARRLLPGVLAGAGAADGVHVEDKGAALGIHTRQAADPGGALDALRLPLAALAERTRLRLEPGRYVLELRPPGVDKGAALRELAAARMARSVLFCGDDLGDLAAFAAVGSLRAAPGPGGATVPGCTVASASPEARQVAAAADLVVDGPPGVVGLLAALADSLGVLRSSPGRAFALRPAWGAGRGGTRSSRRNARRRRPARSGRRREPSAPRHPRPRQGRSPGSRPTR
jgi:trehalose 6-phosphate phosphatase